MHFTLSLWKNVLSLAQFTYCSAFLKPVNGAVQGITVYEFTRAFDSGVACSVMPLSHLICCMLSECNLYFANFLPDCCQWTWCIETLTFRVQNSMLILSFIVLSLKSCQVWGTLLNFVMCWFFFLIGKLLAPHSPLYLEDYAIWDVCDSLFKSPTMFSTSNLRICHMSWWMMHRYEQTQIISKWLKYCI